MRSSTWYGLNKTNPPRTMGEEMAHLRKLRLNTFSDRLKSLYSE